MKLFFITSNNNKFSEAQKIISKLKKLEIDLQEIQEINPKIIIETKLKSAAKLKKGGFIVEDTSLFMDCLNGLPGPLAKWFLKTINTDGLYKIAKAFNNYKAQAKTLIGLKIGKDIKFFEGLVDGLIVKKRGSNGFGWDEIFEIEKIKKTFAELSQDEKNQISMRKIAFTKLKKYLLAQKIKLE